MELLELPNNRGEIVDSGSRLQMKKNMVPIFREDEGEIHSWNYGLIFILALDKIQELIIKQMAWEHLKHILSLVPNGGLLRSKLCQVAQFG